MKRLAVGLTAAAVLVAVSLSVAAQSAEPVDTAAIAKIRDEGLNRSQVMDTMFWLTDRYGPRLTGSAEFEEAGDWAVQQLEKWGVKNVRKERFAFGNGWSLKKFHATMVAPRVMPIIGAVKAWTPGTKGTFVADVVRPEITNEADAEKYRGQLRGKIVLTQPAREVRMLEHGDGTVLRYTDQNGKWREEALEPPAPPAARGGGAGRGGGRAGGAGRGGGRAGGGGAPFSVTAFYESEGVLALFDRGGNSDTAAGGSGLTWQQQRTDGGTFTVQSGGRAGGAPGAGLPQLTLAVEHYNRMVRLLEHDQAVQVELNVETEYRPETADRPNGFNIVGEIPGSDLADEYVLIGGHFDSWQGATGATDNAAGSAAMMEVLRIINATGLRPRRTIRIGLWGAEEGGLVGSREYVRGHLGTRAEPKAEHGKISVYFNLDNGTGPIRGIWMQGNEATRPIFAAWMQPLADLGVEILAPRSVGSTDHSSFENAGVPGFQFVQERYEYNSRTHHTNMDFLDRVQPDAMRQIATVAAVFAWQAANRAALMPRKPAPGGGQ
jgi:hypothetical protein